jgi:hypothetical protein
MPSENPTLTTDTGVRVWGPQRHRDDDPGYRQRDGISGLFALRDLGRLEVKGAQAPARVYELTGLGALRTRLEVARARGFSRFVGRDEETARLEAALGRAMAATRRSWESSPTRA